MGKRTLHCLLTCQFPSSSSVIAYPASSTCQDIMRPRLQLMRAAHSIECRLSWFQSPSQHTRSVSRRPRLISTPQPILVHMSFRPSARVIGGFGVQMIGIVQTQPTPCLLKLLRRQAIQRGLRSHRHENRQRHGAMWEVQRGCSGASRLYI